MKQRILLALFLVFTGLLTFAQEDSLMRGGERVVNFHSDIRIHKNRKVLITETIQVVAKGLDIQRGIFRAIPLTYTDHMKTYRVAFDLLEVQKNGKTEPYHTEWADNGIVVYIGEENVFLDPGVYTYTIRYEVDYVLGMFDDGDELYWNVNGNGWSLFFDKISATVHLPEGATVKRYKAHTGRYGSLDQNFTAKNDSTSITFTTTEMMYTGEGMTIAVGWDKGFLDEPTTGDMIKKHLWMNALVYLGLLTLLIGFLFNFVMWWLYGRDPKPGTIIPRFYPPKGLSPAECAYLDNEGRPTDTLNSSAIISLAVKGWIEIERKGKGYYLLKKSNRKKQELLDGPEKNFYKRLMVKELVVIKSGSYSSRLSSACEKLQSEIDAKQKNYYFVRNIKLKYIQFIFPVITLVVGLMAHSRWGGFVLIPILFTVLHLVLNFVFSRLYEQPTPKGRKVRDEIDGFRMYIKYADQERIKALNPPTMDFHHFEENLAYAIALDLANEWGGKFDPEITEHLDTYMPYMYGMSLHHFSYMSSIGKEISSTISSASTPPSTSGSGGGYSGGFSGGGFSGGGFGGGGGGGW